MGAATAIAAVGAAAAVKSSIDANKNAKSAQKAQVAQNTKNQEFMAKQAQKARADILPRFDQAQELRRQGAANAVDIFGQSLPSQANMFQQGNVGAQQALIAGLPQIQNALMGMPVDFSALQPQQLNFDLSFLQNSSQMLAGMPQAQAKAPQAPAQPSTGIQQPAGTILGGGRGGQLMFNTLPAQRLR